MSDVLQRLIDVIDRANTVDKYLDDGLSEKIKLFINGKQNIDIKFNKVKCIPDSNGNYKKVTTHRDIDSLALSVDQKLQLSKRAIEAFKRFDVLKGEQLSLIYAPNEDYIVNNSQELYSVSHRDIFIEPSLPEANASYIKLIEIAIDELSSPSSKKPNAASVHKWISTELRKKNNSQFAEFLDGIHVYNGTLKAGDVDYDYELEPYSKTLGMVIVLKYDDVKPVKRENFKNQVNKAHKRKLSSSSS
ncbi:MAG: hypothetical protein P8H22_08475 [Glaciecola sp.]|nr:hypothetical protein [Glaciecola sp.]